MLKSILKIISLLGLILTLVPSFMVFSGTIEMPMHKTLMLIGTLLWFFSRPFTMEKESN